MAKETLLPILFHLFRQYGYDGVSLSKIAQATQLGKASLYHHFPGGKAEMLQATLVYSQQWFEENVLAALHSEGEPIDRLQKMCDRLSCLYEQGDQPCLMATLTTGAAQGAFHEPVRQRLQALLEAIAAVLIESGLPMPIAQQRAEDALITVQGALILSRGLKNSLPFQRAIAQLPHRLCQS